MRGLLGRRYGLTMRAHSLVMRAWRRVVLPRPAVPAAYIRVRLPANL